VLPFRTPRHKAELVAERASIVILGLSANSATAEFCSAAL
jgi:hypothetical protein